MKLRRGFKAGADRLVEATRTDLGLSLHDRLNPLSLVEHLGLRYLALSSLRDLHLEDVDHLLQVDTKAFSGTLMDVGDIRAVIINDGHSQGRQANSIAHECSHHMLKHEPETHFEAFGLRTFDKMKELEANWLAGCLLVPSPAVLPAFRRTPNIAACAQRFGVSEELMLQRYNLSGAKQRFERPPRRY